MLCSVWGSGAQRGGRPTGLRGKQRETGRVIGRRGVAAGAVSCPLWIEGFRVARARGVRG